MMNENLHVYCPKCGSEVALADENGKAITPKSGDFFLRLKDNDPEKAKKLKDVIAAMYGNDVEVKNVGSAKESNPEQYQDSSAKSSHEEEDDIEKAIMEEGDINSKFLWRRWIMSQVLRHYKTADGDENFHKYFINDKTMYYVLKMCRNEAKALSGMSGINLEEREMFFNMQVFRDIIIDYVTKYKKEIERKVREVDLANRKKVFKRGFNTRLQNHIRIEKKVFYLTDIANEKKRLDVLCSKAANASTYKDIIDILGFIIKNIPPFKTCKKPKAWINAFKGAGAFYTMDNLFRWHECTVSDEKTGEVYSGDRALKYLRDKAKSLSSEEYYKLYAIMKRVIEENHFDFGKRMAELHNDEVA